MSATVLYMSISPDRFMTGPNESLQTPSPSAANAASNGR